MDLIQEIKEKIKEEIKDEIKQEIKEELKEEIEKIKEFGSTIDDKVEETASKYQVPKWIVWLSGAAVVGVIIKFLF